MNSNSETIRMVFARNVKEYRTALHYSQEKLAEKTGLSVQTIKDIEACRRWISDNSLTKISKALKIAEFQLLLPEKCEITQYHLKSRLKSLIALKEKIKTYMDTQFEDALNDIK
jgi:transcriptional regulator with XRE-family HTH domain